MPTPRTPDPTPGWIADMFEGALGGGLGYDPPEGSVTAGSTGAAQAAAGAATAVKDATGIGGLVDGVQAVRRWVSDRHNWARVGYVLGGTILFMVGVARLAAPTVGKAAGAVTAVVTKGKSLV